MTPEKKGRVATAAGFLSGLLASMDALRDARVTWPPDALWAALQSSQRLELGGGIAVIVVTIVASALRRRGG